MCYGVFLTIALPIMLGVGCAELGPTSAPTAGPISTPISSNTPIFTETLTEDALPSEAPTSIQDPTNTIIPAPTNTPPVSCTPPPCRLGQGEVYYCAGTCPGGCGTSCATVTPMATPTATPTANPPTNIAKVPTPTSGSLHPVLLTLTEPEIMGLTNSGIKAAFEDVARRVVGDTSHTGILRADQATWPDSSLGCPEPDHFYTQVLTSGIWLVLDHDGQEFDYRTAGSQVILCQQDQPTDPLKRTPLGGLWSSLSSMPTPRSEVAVVPLDGKVYVFGGFGSGANSNEEYDPATNTWRRLAPIPRGVDHSAAISTRGKAISHRRV